MINIELEEEKRNNQKYNQYNIKIIKHKQKFYLKYLINKIIIINVISFLFIKSYEKVILIN